MFNFVFFNDPKMESFQSQLRITDHHWCTQGTTNTRTFKMAGLLILTTPQTNPDYNYGRAENDTGNHFQQKDQSNQTDHCPSSKIFSPSMNSHLKLRRPSQRTLTTWYTSDQRKTNGRRKSTPRSDDVKSDRWRIYCTTQAFSNVNFEINKIFIFQNPNVKMPTQKK